MGSRKTKPLPCLWNICPFLKCLIQVSISNQSSKDICMLNSLDYSKSFPNIEIWVASLTDVPLEKKKEGIGTR